MIKFKEGRTYLVEEIQRKRLGIDRLNVVKRTEKCVWFNIHRFKISVIDGVEVYEGYITRSKKAVMVRADKEVLLLTEIQI